MRRHHHHHSAGYDGQHHSRIQRRDAYRAAAALGLVALLLIAAFFLIRQWEDKRYAASGAGQETSAGQEASERPDITYNGVVYSPKQQVEAYLFMGIDVDGPAVSKPGNYNGGQADAQFLIVLDNEDQTWSLLRLNRDSMVDVPVLSLKGEVIGYERQQLALAHAYGDGTKQSCENTVSTVSTLLGGQTIDGYASLNMDGIAVLNDAIGGVTVTITSDFTLVDPTLVEGETITLHGEQAMRFVRSRMDVDDQTNLARMERQRAYLEAMQPQLLALSDEDILRTYDEVSDYVVTDLGSQDMLDLAEKLRGYQQLYELTIDGTNTVEDGHMAYILDEDSLQQTILALFYQEKQ